MNGMYTLKLCNAVTLSGGRRGVKWPGNKTSDLFALAGRPNPVSF